MLVNLNDVLYKAQEGHYAVGLFNTIDTDMLESVICAAEEMNSPIIIGTAEVLLPFGELKLIAPSIISAAKRATVPVVVHYDHGLTFERCMEALKLGFSSVMFDGSVGNSEKNIIDTREVVRIAHAMGATVEGEIGHVGEAKNCDNATNDQYTTVKEAKDFVSSTGVDALAIAIGTAHGMYKAKPCLDIDRLKEIKSNVLTPLVLHGGSGLSDDDFRNSIKEGISKVNIFTDLCVAGENAMKSAIAGAYYSSSGTTALSIANRDFQGFGISIQDMPANGQLTVGPLMIVNNTVNAGLRDGSSDIQIQIDGATSANGTLTSNGQ